MYKKLEIIGKTFKGLLTSGEDKKPDKKGKPPSPPSEQTGKNEMGANDEIDSIIKIQALIRGFLDQRAYAIHQLHKSKLQLYPVMIKGNDPALSKDQEEKLPRHGKEEKIALIGTSGMRSVEFACQLSEGTPKLIILDNSIQVILFWRKTKQIIDNTSNTFDFLKTLKAYISQDCDELDLTIYQFGNRSSKKLNSPSRTLEEFAYLEGILFDKYGFEQIKKIISNMVIISQSWADKDVIVKVKNILAYNDIAIIYAYPSNIVAYVNDNRAEAEKILENIQLLNPDMAIHTDSIYTPGQGNRPEKIYFVKKNEHKPSAVRELLKIDKDEFEEDPIFKIKS